MSKSNDADWKSWASIVTELRSRVARRESVVGEKQSGWEHVTVREARGGVLREAMT